MLRFAVFCSLERFDIRFAVRTKFFNPDYLRSIVISFLGVWSAGRGGRLGLGSEFSFLSYSHKKRIPFSQNPPPPHPPSHSYSHPLAGSMELSQHLHITGIFTGPFTESITHLVFGSGMQNSFTHSRGMQLHRTSDSAGGELQVRTRLSR